MSVVKTVGLAILLLFGIPGTGPSEIPYGTGSWDAETFGNHRALIMVASEADAVFVRIPWRRRDLNPESKDIVILSESTGIRIRNLCRVSLSRECGDLVFQPVSGAGTYAVYYLVNHMEGRSNYPTVTYPPSEETADHEWLVRNGLAGRPQSRDVRARLPEASVCEFQSIDEFHSFYPMEVIATAAEVDTLLADFPDAEFLLFPEDRRFPIRMTRDLPRRWLAPRLSGGFSGEAVRGEYYTLQLGVFACRADLEGVTVSFNGLTERGGKSRIEPNRFTCFNTGGIDWKGRPFRKSVSIPRGKVQALWCGVQIPPDISPGEYDGRIEVGAVGIRRRSVSMRLTIGDEEALVDAGDSEPWRHSRLRWLNSRLALDEDLIDPYTPLEVKDNLIRCLGRAVRLGDLGFPAAMMSFFTPEVTGTAQKAHPILADPVRFTVQDGGGRELPWKDKQFRFVKKAPGIVEWSGSAGAGEVGLEYTARMEPEGFLDFQVRITAQRTVDVADIALVVPFEKSAARYMLGMGVRGGQRPTEFEWRWAPDRNQDSVWLGTVNAGLQCSFRDNRYSRPLNTNFYLLKPLVMPQSWWNGGNGACTITESDGDVVNLRVSSGPRRLDKGETQHFFFSFLITPFRAINPMAQWATRFYHRYAPVEEIASTGANTVNVHHANEINPYINYPFLRPGAMKEYIDRAHRRSMRVKIYYTVRELSNRAPELFALRSLGDEVFFPGKGGGFSWLQEHLDQDYIAAWFVPDLQDAAIINSGVSRWHNYYVEGLNWLLRNVGIDGLYIDDVAFDRTVMKRVRKVLDRNRPGALIDLHSANQFNPRDGYANSANLYMEHFPYIDRLWFGEYFDYDAAPDYWLVEVSGIPFGLMGEMLQDGGNPWRGMLFGMTSRLPWAGDPRELWKVWDAFAIQESDMIGFWSDRCPVSTDHPKVLATVYAQKERALVSLASWADKPVNVRLNISWDSLGFARSGVEILAPGIPDFQARERFFPEDAIPVEPGRGWLLILSKPGMELF